MLTNLASLPTMAWSMLAWVATFLIHSSVFFLAALLLDRCFASRTRLREGLWKCALVGGLVTASLPSAPRILYADLHPIASQPEAPIVASRPTSTRPPTGWRDGEPAIGDTPMARQLTSPAATPLVLVQSESRTSRSLPPAKPLPVAFEQPQDPSRGSSTPASAGPAWPGPLPQTGFRSRPSKDLPALVREGWPAGVIGLWILTTAILWLRVLWQRQRLLRHLQRRRLSEHHSLTQMARELAQLGGWRRPLRVSLSSRLAGPISLSSREICVPQLLLTELQPQQQRCVLAHEVAHIVRRDPSWFLLVGLLEKLLFFQPLLRLARRRFHETAEFLCDDWAVQQTGNGLTLARCLAQVGTWMQGPKRPAFLPSLGARGSLVVRRVERLLDESKRSHYGPRSWSPLMAIFLLPTVFWLVPQISIGAPTDPTSDPAGQAIVGKAVATDPGAEPQPETPAATPSVRPEETPAGLSVALPLTTPAPAPWRGLTFSGLREELAAHLGLAGNTALLVEEVTTPSTAATAGLEKFDVIVAVQGQDATRTALEQALRSPDWVDLQVIRRGQEAQLSLAPAALAATTLESAGQQDFFSSDEVHAEHPFRQIRQLRDMRKRYEEKIKEYSQLLDQTRKDANQASSHAQQEQGELRAQYDHQVRDVVEDWRKRISAEVEARLQEKPWGRLVNSGARFADVQEKAWREAVDERLNDIKRTLQEEYPKQFQTTRALFESSRDNSQQFQQLFNGFPNELQAMFNDRIDGMVKQSLRKIDQYRGFLDNDAPRRIQGMLAQLPNIRSQVQHRVKCASERTRKEFNDQLNRRLTQYEVPAPGEVEGCLQDMRQQVHAMALRFQNKSRGTLQDFEGLYSSVNAAFVPATQQHCSHLLDVLDQVCDAVEEGLKDTKKQRWCDDERRHPRQMRELHLRLRETLQESFGDGRTDLRRALRELEEEFRRHCEEVDEALDAAEALLRDLHKEAANRCWKLDGPHLDGRFPRWGETKEKGKGQLVLDMSSQ